MLMKSSQRLWAVAALLALTAAAQAQTTRPQRPAESYGQPASARPEGAPQRPAQSQGWGGQRPADATGQSATRPAESYGQRGQRPEGVTGRPRGR